MLRTPKDRDTIIKRLTEITEANLSNEQCGAHHGLPPERILHIGNDPQRGHHVNVHGLGTRIPVTSS